MYKLFQSQGGGGLNSQEEGAEATVHLHAISNVVMARNTRKEKHPAL